MVHADMMRQWINLFEDRQKFYHGSAENLSIGTILVPQNDYHEHWQHNNFYTILEAHRPPAALAHHAAVFMVTDDNDLDLVGAMTEWVFVVEPLGPIEKHDMNWGTMIDVLISDGASSFDEEVVACARSYWSGDSSPNEAVWEYLTTSARILSSEPF